MQAGSGTGSVGARQRADSVAPARSRSSLRGNVSVTPPDTVSAVEADPQEHLPGTAYVDTVPAIQMESGMTLEEPRPGSSIPAWTPPLFAE